MTKETQSIYATRCHIVVPPLPLGIRKPSLLDQTHPLNKSLQLLNPVFQTYNVPDEKGASCENCVLYICTSRNIATHIFGGPRGFEASLMTSMDR